MAGVVCTGGLSTRATLLALTGRAAAHPPTDGLCAGGCGNRLVTARHGPTQPGEAPTAARGMCRACYYAAYRTHTLPVRTPTPRDCSVCFRPMTTKSRRIPGHVVHESNGRCVGCARAVSRKRDRLEPVA